MHDSHAASHTRTHASQPATCPAERPLANGLNHHQLIKRYLHSKRVHTASESRLLNAAVGSCLPHPTARPFELWAGSAEQAADLPGRHIHAAAATGLQRIFWRHCRQSPLHGYMRGVMLAAELVCLQQCGLGAFVGTLESRSGKRPTLKAGTRLVRQYMLQMHA